MEALWTIPASWFPARSVYSVGFCWYCAALGWAVFLGFMVWLAFPNNFWSLSRKERRESLRSAVGSVLKVSAWALVAIVVLFTIGMIGMWIVSLTDNRVGVGIRYDLDDSKVLMERKPHDCEWGAAPIGDKHCHYQMVVSPRMIPSHNGEEPLTFPDTLTEHNVESVTVTWDKIQD